MAFRLGVGPNHLDLSIWADEYRAAYDPQKRLPQEALHAARTIGFDHFEVGVAEQREIQLELRLKLRQRLDGIGATAGNRDSQLVELRLRVAKLGRFRGSTGCERFRKEIKDQPLTAKIGKRHFATVIRWKREIGRLVSWIEHVVFRLSLIRMWLRS